ncbi:MAG: hypothetical protein H7144_08350 [Burkholderiales bacterium]|nr:hypothetical protein [Phycisphaerae bacterium]
MKIVRSSFTRIALLPTLLLALFGTATARAESPPTTATPTPADLVAKTIEAGGGREKALAVKSLSMKATMTLAAQNLAGSVEMLRKNDKALILIEMPGVGLMRYGIEGKLAYEQSDLMGVRLLAEAEKKQLTDGLDPQSQLDRLMKLTNPVVSGPEQIGGATAWKLTGKTDTGDPESHWIDTTSNQTVRSSIVIASVMGKMNATLDFADFKLVDGMTIPMTIKQSMGPMSAVITIKEIAINPEIDDEKFVLPDEVKKLAAAQDAKPSTQPGAASGTQPPTGAGGQR